MLTTATFTAGLLFATSAWAGPGAEEIWFGTGADSLATDENNAVTSEGAKTKTDEVDQIPGEEDWEVRIAAKLNGYAGTGPLYVEFYQTIQGTEHIVWRHEEPNYDGNRNMAITTVLEGNHGFNKNREYRVQVVQNNGKRDIVLARGKVKLVDTGREVPEEEDEGGDDEPSKQDEIDTLAGEDDEEEDEGEAAGDGEAPPPIDDTPAKKKGCSVVDEPGVGFSGMLILIALGWATRRRED
ncbi:hypothetical protein ACNOYE_10885 [Nannocystaceae bacterium ST9]